MVTKVKGKTKSKRQLRKELNEIAWEGLTRTLQGKSTKQLMKKAQALKRKLES